MFSLLEFRIIWVSFSLQIELSKWKEATNYRYKELTTFKAMTNKEANKE